MPPIGRRRFIQLAGGAGALGLLAGYPVCIERNLIRTNHYRIPVPRLPPAFAGFRIAHLTDLHYGTLVSADMIRAVVERVMRLAPDAIVCTGDYVHARRTTREIDVVWPLLAALRAPAGVFAVLGNHDHWADRARSFEWLARTGQDLNHRVRPVERGGRRLWFAGAGDLWEDHRHLDGLLEPIPPEDCRIVLAHNPDTADSTFSSRVDLMLCGHTHGGQVVLPWIGAPVLPVRNKRYTSGLIQTPHGFPVFISRGVGWAILPVRFNCRPEIAVLELAPAPA